MKHHDCVYFSGYLKDKIVAPLDVLCRARKGKALGADVVGVHEQ